MLTAADTALHQLGITHGDLLVLLPVRPTIKRPCAQTTPVRVLCDLHNRLAQCVVFAFIQPGTLAACMHYKGAHHQHVNATYAWLCSRHHPVRTTYSVGASETYPSSAVRAACIIGCRDCSNPSSHHRRGPQPWLRAHIEGRTPTRCTSHFASPS